MVKLRDDAASQTPMQVAQAKIHIPLDRFSEVEPSSLASPMKNGQVHT
jgi:hypothetical protein